MQLHSLTLHGFKSFGDKISIEFSKGVTGIVGPNGSGKSNILDGLKWTTGGGRASQYRAGDKTDLIFHGADGKRSVSHAEVELELIKGKERIKVTRNLFRDGTTTLKLNGKNAKLQEVEEKLAGTGLGRGGLAIVGQGEVGQVLTADPEKLLNYVAEAADVSRLSNRREQTQNRLEAAATNLQRLDDIMQELEFFVEQLREEAELAQKHEALTKESLRLRFTISLQREQGLREDVKNLKQQDEKLSHDLEKLRAQRVKLQANWQETRNKASKLELIYREALTKAEAQKADVRIAEERLDALKQQLIALEREHASLQSEISFIELSHAPEKPEENSADLENSKQTLELKINELQNNLKLLEQTRLSQEQDLKTLRSKLGEENRASASYQSSLQRLKQQELTLTQRLEQIKENTNQNETDLEASVKQLESQTNLEAETLEALKETLSNALQEQAKRFAEAQALQREAEQSRNAFEARRGYATGPKLALNSGIDGIVGSVADILSVAPKYRQAVAAALGRRSEYVITNNAQTAQTVIDYVKQKGGWVTVLPLDLVKGQEIRLSNTVASAKGVIGLATQVVNVEERYKSLMYQLLGSSCLIENMQDAVNLAKQEKHRPRLVSLDGNLMESYGAMSGGQSKTNVSVLGAAKDLEDLEEQAEQAAEQAAEQKEIVNDLQTNARNAQEQLKAKQIELQSNLQTLRKKQEQSSINSSLKLELEQQLSTVQTELKNLSSPEASETQAQVSELEELALNTQAKLKEKQVVLTEQQNQQRNTQESIRLSQERQKLYQQNLLAYQQNQDRLNSLKPKLELLKENQSSLKEALITANLNLDQAKERLPKNLHEHQNNYANALTESQELEQSLSNLSETQAETAAELEKAKISLARREAALEIAIEEHKAFPQGIEILELSTRACRDRLNTVTQELESIGPVNHRAAHDLKLQKDRYEDLQIQTVQATLAVTELEAILSKIDTEVNSKLRKAVAQLKIHFANYVRELFGQDAKANVIMHENDDRPTGLSIILQPPGKQTQSLNLLSVGERTMGAMAFLFSLLQGQEGQRLPIAILDEVDAPLDEANIRRYCTFLEYLAKEGTQFVLITHQKATFEVADVLWGITSEKGVSRVFSISKRDVEAA